MSEIARFNIFGVTVWLKFPNATDRAQIKIIYLKYG
jgi:hypothetical protein